MNDMPTLYKVTVPCLIHKYDKFLLAKFLPLEVDIVVVEICG